MIIAPRDGRAAKALATTSRAVSAMQQAIEPVAESRNDFDIAADLAARLGVGEAFTEGRSERQWLQWIYATAAEVAAKRGFEMPAFETFWETGHLEFPAPPSPHTMLREFREDPDGHPLSTPSRAASPTATSSGCGTTAVPAWPARW